jgi:heme oxygenase
MAPPEPESLLRRLRLETQAAHEALDASVGAVITRSRPDYAAFLRCSLAAVALLEEAIAPHLGETHLPERAERIRADLAALGEAATSPPLEPIVLDTRAEAFGAAYVVEGSALGGMFLADRVRSALGADSPCSYLALRGSSTGARWKWFLNELAVFDGQADEPARIEAVATANRTFARYRLAFGQPVQ